jgi:hypothetical protein
MRGVLQDSLYAIYDTQTAKFLKFGSKIAWTSQGAAKNAYHNYSWKDQLKFDEQSRYIVVSIDSNVVALQEMK